MRPDYAFILLISGLLGVYAELARPGLVAPGLAGCVLSLSGAYFLSRDAPSGLGLALLSVAVLLFVAEAFWRVNFVAGVFAIMALTCGFCVLLRETPRISLALAIPVSVVFGSITLVLVYGAKRARQNKWADLDEGASAELSERKHVEYR